MRITALMAILVLASARLAGNAPVECESMKGVKLSGGSAYPATAHYVGTGSTDDARNFQCK